MPLPCKHKRSFCTKHEAKAMLKSTLESPSTARKECRIYLCDGPTGCHTYHLTSMSLEDFQTEAERPLSFEQQVVHEYLEGLN